MQQCLQPQDQKYSQDLLWFLVRFQLIKNSNHELFHNKILSEGFDITGDLIEGVRLLGFSGIQIGPIAYKPQQKVNQFGILYAKANINEYFQGVNQQKKANNQKNQEGQKNKSKFRVGVSIFPNSQICDLTPYLISDHLLKCMDSISRIYEQSEDTEKKQQTNTKLTNKQSKQSKQTEANLIEFISINKDRAFEKVQPQIKQQIKNIMQNSFNKQAIRFCNQKSIDLYEVKNSQHTPLYTCTSNKTEQVNFSKYQFISVRQLISQIARG